MYDLGFSSAFHQCDSESVYKRRYKGQTTNMHNRPSSDQQRHHPRRQSVTFPILGFIEQMQEMRNNGHALQICQK